MSEQPERVEGKTFDEWVEEYTPLFGSGAVEAAMMAFGWKGDTAMYAITFRSLGMKNA